MPPLEPTMLRNVLPPIAPEPGNGRRGLASRDVIRRIAVTAFVIAAMAGLGLMLIDLAIDKLSSLSFLRLSGLF